MTLDGCIGRKDIFPLFFNDLSQPRRASPTSPFNWLRATRDKRGGRHRSQGILMMLKFFGKNVKIILMKTEITKQPKSRVKFNITLSRDEMAKYFDEAYEEMAPSVSIKGFRPGKAPKPMVAGVIGEMKLAQKAVEKGLQGSFVKALKEKEIMSVGPPTISIKDQKEGLEYEAEVDTWPMVELGDYKKLSVRAPKVEIVTEKEIDGVIEYLRRQKAKFHDLERPVQKGDRVEIDFTGSIDKVIKEQLTSQHHPLIVGDNTLIPGFEEQLIGMKKGEEKNFELTFPKQSSEKEFAGKKINFKIKLHLVQEIELPKVDELFIKDFGLKDEKELRSSIKKSIEREKEEKSRREVEQAVVEKVLTIAKVEVPDSLVEQELDRVFHNLEHEAKNYGMILEQYLLKMKKSAADLRKEWREQAEKNVKIGVVLGEVAKREKVDKGEKDLGKKTTEKLVGYLTK